MPLYPAVWSRRCRIPVTAAVVGLGLGLALPASARAQNVAPTDLIGSWVMSTMKDFTLTLRADSTMTYTGNGPQGKSVMTAKWHLAGDTLLASGVKATVNGQRAQGTLVPRLVAVKNGKLTTIRLKSIAGQPDTLVYEHVDSLPTP